MSDKSPFAPFGLVSQDVRTQLSFSREILEVAGNLQSQLFHIEDATTRAAIQDAITSLIGIANRMTTNAANTTTTAAVAVSGVVGVGIPGYTGKK